MCAYAFRVLAFLKLSGQVERKYRVNDQCNIWMAARLAYVDML